MQDFHFKFVTTDSCDDPDCLTYFNLVMSRVNKDISESKVVIGNTYGCIVDLENSSGNFFSVVDADSQELQGAGCLCFDNMGEVREPLRSQLIDLESLDYGEGWLYVKEISLIEEERGHMLSLTMLRALFKIADFSVSCLFPAAWGEEDKNRREEDPLRQVKIQKIARLFAQIGYRQIGKSDYMFLEKSQLQDNLITVEEGDIMTYAPSHHLGSSKPDLSPLDDELVNAIQAAHPDLARVRKAITSGADMRKCCALQRCAVSKGTLGLLKYLLECGVDVNHQDHMGMTALMVATSVNAVEIVRELLLNGANKMLLNCDNQTAIDMNKSCAMNNDDFLTTFAIPVTRFTEHIRIKEMLDQNTPQ